MSRWLILRNSQTVNMVTCTYCGAETDQKARYCAGCAQELPAPAETKPQPDRSDAQDSFENIDLSKIDGAFDYIEGFHRPVWQRIGGHIDANTPEEDRPEAWNEAVRQWVLKLRDDLGGSYQVLTSEAVLLLCDCEPEAAARLLEFSGRTAEVILKLLPGIAWNDAVARDVALAFSDEDDYYQYVAYFYPEGEHPRSAGAFLGGDVPHLALVSHHEQYACETIAHELTHHSLAHLPLPTWLNEGLAVTVDRAVGVNREPMMDEDLAEQHKAYWNEANIQEFWAGTSWHNAGEGFTLCYSLAEVLVHLLKEDRLGFLAFVSRAHYDDAGQTAALECLGTNLGDAVGTFLGPGNWRPYRKAMVALWGNGERAEESGA